MAIQFEILDFEWAKRLEEAFDEYMDSLAEGVDDDVDLETESGQPYCGCSTCYTREIISFLAPRVIAGYDNSKIKLV